MREMKDSGIKWLGAIPQQWDIVKYKALFEPKSIPNSGDRELLSVYLDRGVIRYSDSSNMQVHKPSESLDKYQNVDIGDFVLNNQQAWRGSVGVSKYRGIISPAYLIYEMSKECFPQYMNYALRDCYMVQQYEYCSRGVGTIQRNVSPQWLKQALVLLPPLDEQKRIASYLDVKCAEIDSLIENIQAQIGTLESYRASTISEKIMHGVVSCSDEKDSGFEWIGKTPSHWMFIKGKYLFAQRNSKGNRKSLELLSPSQKFGVIPQTLLETLTTQNVVKVKEDTDLASFKTIHKGDFCISLRSFQGGFEYSRYEGVVSSAYQVFYPTVAICDDYYRFLFKDKGFIEKMNSYTISFRDGKNIAFSDFGNTYLPYPPVDEQKAIAAYLDEKCAEIDGCIAAKKEQISTLEAYKKSVIFEYVTGKKEVE